MQVQFTYEKFRHAIKEQQDKFWQISKKKIGEPLSDGLFSAFFALYVIPLRANLFPNIHEEIEERRKRPRKEKLNLGQRKKKGKKKPRRKKRE